MLSSLCMHAALRPCFSTSWHFNPYILQHFSENVFTLVYTVDVIHVATLYVFSPLGQLCWDICLFEIRKEIVQGIEELWCDIIHRWCCSDVECCCYYYDIPVKSQWITMILCNSSPLPSLPPSSLFLIFAAFGMLSPSWSSNDNCYCLTLQPSRFSSPE